MSGQGQPILTPAMAEVRSLGLFAGLPDAEVPALMAMAVECEHKKGQRLFSQGEACTGFFVVLAGMVRLFKVAPDGREHVVEVIRPGQSFAEAVVFSGHPFPVYAEPLANSRLLFFPKEPFLSFLEERPRCLFGMIASLSVRMHQLVLKVERLTLQDARQRVAGFFADLARVDGEKAALDISKKTLAAQLGLTPETLSRTLAALQEEGVLAVDGRSFSVPDSEALLAASRGFPAH